MSKWTAPNDKLITEHLMRLLLWDINSKTTLSEHWRLSFNNSDFTIDKVCYTSITINIKL